MGQRDKLSVERNDRPALERERHQLTKELYEKGLVTREAFERELEAPMVMESQREDA